jgi:hypothetical protein
MAAEGSVRLKVRVTTLNGLVYNGDLTLATGRVRRAARRHNRSSWRQILWGRVETGQITEAHLA